MRPLRNAISASAVVAIMLAGAPALVALQARAQTESRGGQPPLGTMPSVSDLEAQVAYLREFEAVVWAMPAVAIYRLRVEFLEMPGVADNVVIAYSAPLTQSAEVITGNTTTPYIGVASDLRAGPIVFELPAKTDKAIYGQITDAWQATLADVGPAGQDKGAGGKEPAGPLTRLSSHFCFRSLISLHFRLQSTNLHRRMAASS